MSARPSLGARVDTPLQQRCPFQTWFLAEYFAFEWSVLVCLQPLRCIETYQRGGRSLLSHTTSVPNSEYDAADAS